MPVLKNTCVVLMAIAGGAAVASATVPADRHPADSEVVLYVNRGVAEWEIKPEDRGFDNIGWATELLEARRLAQEHGRPVFVFTHNGRIAIGRC